MPSPSTGWFGPYRAVARIARGGMGEVWRAEHPDLGLAVAVKAVPAASRAMFDREVANIATLSHPGIVQIFDRGVVAEGWSDLPPGTPWLAMELAGSTLETRPPRDLHELRRVLLRVLDALGHAHGRGVLHLDVKPTNLLRDGVRVLIADFGISTVLHRELDGGWGSPGFAPPEQLAGRWRDLGPWTDLFALGATAAFLAGDAPGPALAAWIDRATQPLPTARFQSAAEARDALLDSHGASGFPPLPPPEPLRRQLAGAGAALFGQRTVPLVARDAERRALWSALGEVVVSGAPRWIWLDGPSGVGKSRLADWLVTHAHAATGCRVWRALHTTHGQDGLRDAARDALATRGLHGAALAQRLSWTIGAVPGLADVLEGRPLPTQASARALAGALRAVAPVVLWIDDAQDADTELLAALAEALSGAVLVVASCRTDRLDDRSRARLSSLPGQRIALGPLTDQALRAMLGELLGLDPASASAITERATGNPMVAVQLVAGALAAGELKPGRSGLQVEVEALRLPRSLTELWARRIAQVVGDDRPAVELAAVLGHRFEAAWRRGVGPADDLVERMLRAQLWWSVDGELRWTHEMAREAVLEAAGDRLVDLHRRAAACVDPEADPGQAGRHRIAAGELEAGARLLARAVKVLAARGEWLAADRADRELERALARIDSSGGLAIDRLLERARMAHNRKRDHEARERLDALRETVLRDGEPLQRDLFHWLCGRVLLGEGRPLEALASFEQAAAIPGGTPARRAQLLCDQSRCLRDAGDPSGAVERLREAVRAAPAGHVVGANVQLTLGVTLHMAGRLDEAQQAYHDAIAAYGEAHPGAQADVWTNLGTLHRHRGERAEAQAAYDRARQLLDATGTVPDSLDLGLALLWIDEAPDRARATLEALCDRAAGSLRAGYAHLYLLPLCSDPDDWDRHWRAGHELMPELAADPDLAQVLARAADHADAWGWPQRAAASREAGEAVRRKLGR